MKKQQTEIRGTGRRAAAFLLSFLFLFASFAATGETVWADPAQPAGVYTVQKGDSLCGIARSLFGDEKQWKALYDLNSNEIKVPSKIYPGQSLKVAAPEAAVPAAPVTASDPELVQALERAVKQQEAAIQARAAADQAAAAAETVIAQGAQKAAVQSTAASETTPEAEAKKLAETIYQKAAASEPQVTVILESMESDKARLEGLDFRLKTKESIARKLVTDAKEMEVSVAEAASTIKDALRYTFVIDTDSYTEATKKTMDTLIAKGYKVIKINNAWESKSYKGINAALKDSNGTVFELQFHTPESYDTKQNKTHEYYEIIRSDNATAAEKAEAQKKNDALFSAVPVPAGAADISY